MPRKMPNQSLSAAFVRTVNKPGMYADGNGLNLKVVPSGARWWVQRVTIGGKRHNIGWGAFRLCLWPRPGNGLPRTRG